jgi:hypothetical protein
MVKGRKPAQLTASGFDPVLKPEMWSRPERIASICAAFDWTGKKTISLPVFAARKSRKSAQAVL